MGTINVTRSSMPGFEEYCNEIKELWESRFLTNMGVKHQALEEGLASYLHAPAVTLFVNGHMALENLLAAYGFPKGSEVITTPFTFASTTHAIVRAGLVPVFCDIDRESLCIDPDKIEGLITDKTVAVLPVHVYGRVCAAEKIGEIAARHGLKVIYDAAHAFGVKYKGVSVANLGDAAMYSFHATKVFHTVEGGALAYRDKELTGKLNAQKNFGFSSPECCDVVGGNAKMNEFCAAMGLCNLRHVDEEIKKRGEACAEYRRRLAGIDGITLPTPQQGVEENYAYFPVLFETPAFTRDDAFAVLKEHGVIARKYFYPLTNDFPCYKDLPTAGKEKTPVASYVADRVLTLPLFADLKKEDVDRIADILIKEREDRR